MMKRFSLTFCLLLALLASCTPVDLNAPVPVFNTGINPDSWVTIPAGEFLSGQFNHGTLIDYDYEIMVTDVTVTQYVDYLNAALADGSLVIDGRQVVGYYPGDAFHGARHELEIAAGEYLHIPLDDPASAFVFDGNIFTLKAGYADHPMTNVSWFGAWGYCGYHDFRLTSELEWEKAARGTDGRPFPWGDEIARNQANFYTSRDPFEDMSTFGSRTTPVGFYNGMTYAGFQTMDGVSPYGLYDMAGNVWQWTGDIYEGMHYRFLRGGSKDTYDMDLRIWVRNNATPTYYSPAVGFRCVRLPD